MCTQKHTHTERVSDARDEDDESRIKSFSIAFKSVDFPLEKFPLILQSLTRVRRLVDS